MVDVDPDSRVFKDLCKHFRKDWAEAKGPCPDVNKGTILRIVNPAVSERFEKYRKGLPLFRRGLEHYYHGTKLKCRVDETLMFCKTTDCGVCGIAKRGFDPQKMGKSDVKFQRFGEGFYLAPNSSKSHDYTREYTSDTIHGILQCDVAQGKSTTWNRTPGTYRDPLRATIPWLESIHATVPWTTTKSYFTTPLRYVHVIYFYIAHCNITLCKWMILCFYILPENLWNFYTRREPS